MAIDPASEPRNNWPPYEDANEEPWKDVVAPATLVHAEQAVYAETDESTPLYIMNQDVTTLTHKGPTVMFERAEHEIIAAEDDSTDDGEAPAAWGKPRLRHLFYLAHPAEAHRRAELGASYYVTSVSRQTAGNVRLDKKSARPLPFQKPEFRAFLSRDRSAWHSPLFDAEDGETLLFTARPRWGRGRYEWADSGGGVVAFEDDAAAKDGRRRLVISVPMSRGLRDALVALWCLRLWHDSAESKGPETTDGVDAKLANLTYLSQFDQRMVKRTSALGSLAAGGGC
ncbi:hypothetical protein F4779DRAFT_618414 [Xylariaceae sp. FL0662B]|nr:hypothetical protein F4779DRAFT_618414 [Xylariaceae sp. FL0662B]